MITLTCIDCGTDREVVSTARGQHGDMCSSCAQMRDGKQRRAQTPGPWAEAGLCAQVDGEIWFPEKGDHGRATQARAICSRCPRHRRLLGVGAGDRPGVRGLRRRDPQGTTAAHRTEGSGMSATLNDALETTGATYRQLDYWARKGYLHAPGRGTGNYRAWDETELAVATVIRRLADAGLDASVAADAARAIMTSGYPTARIGPGITITVGGAP